MSRTIFAESVDRTAVAYIAAMCVLCGVITFVGGGYAGALAGVLGVLTIRFCVREARRGNL